MVRYLASFALTAADGLALGVDSTVKIPNLSLIFVVPVIIAGVSLGLGPSLFSAILGALAFNFFLTEPATHSLSTTRQTFGQLDCCLSSNSS